MRMKKGRAAHEAAYRLPGESMATAPRSGLRLARSSASNTLTNFGRAFGSLLLAGTCGTAAAYDFSACQVMEVVLADAQNAHVQLSCSISNRPTCASTSAYFTFDKSTTAGKQYLALILSAQAQSANLTGNVSHDEGSCPAWQSNVALLVHLRMTR